MTLVGRWRHLISVVALLFLCRSLLPAQAVRNADSLSLERLATLGQLGGSVRDFHPDLAQPGAHWDSAVVAAIPRVEAARNRQQYVKALQELLATLGDPATLVSTGEPGVAVPQRYPSGATWVRDSILIITLPDHEDWSGAIALFTQQREAITRARGVVFDFRTNTVPQSSALGYAFDYTEIARTLSTSPLSTPDEQRRMHSGFPPEAGGTSGGYFSGSYTVSGSTWPAIPAAR